MAITEQDKYYANKLKELRESRNIKQFAMFEHLGLDNQQRYSDLENGKKHFTFELIFKICKFFNISTLEFRGNLLETNNLKEFPLLDELAKINAVEDAHVREVMCRKLLLEAEIKAVDAKLKSMHNEYVPSKITPNRNSVYVII